MERERAVRRKCSAQSNQHMQRPGGEKAGLFKELRVIHSACSSFAGDPLGRERKLERKAGLFCPSGGGFPFSIPLGWGGKLSFPNPQLVRVMKSGGLTSF